MKRVGARGELTLRRYRLSLPFLLLSPSSFALLESCTDSPKSEIQCISDALTLGDRIDGQYVRLRNQVFEGLDD